MRRLLLAILAIILVSCGSGSPSPGPSPIPPTETSPPKIPTNTPTPLPPTSTPRPTRTPNPTETPELIYDAVAIADVEAALKAAGYRRFPFRSGDGTTGFSWVGNSAYERVRTWETGMMELQVLHDKSSQVRADHMERHFAALDSALPAGFMERLRQENAVYNQSVASTVTGEPDQIFPLNDEWHTVWAEYYIREINLGGYWVDFSLWWWQSTCPSEAAYCYYEDFPGLEFEGDSSFVFYSIFVWLPETPDLPSSGA
jgi:hypothetical protein